MKEAGQRLSSDAASQRPDRYPPMSASSDRQAGPGAPPGGAAPRLQPRCLAKKAELRSCASAAAAAL